MSNAKSLRSKLLSTSSIQALVSLLGLANVFILTQIYSPSQLGFFFFILAFIQLFFSISDLGSSTAYLRTLVDPKKSQEKSFVSYTILKLILITISSLIVLGSYLFLDKNKFIEITDPAGHLFLFFLIFLSVAFKALSIIGETQLFFLQKPNIALIPKLAAAILRIGGLLVVSQYGLNATIASYVVILLISEIVQTLWYGVLLKEDVIEALNEKNKGNILNFVGQSLPFSAINISFQVEQNLERVLIGTLLSLEWLALYMIALRIVDVVEIAARQVVGVLLPAFSIALSSEKLSLSTIGLDAEKDLVTGCIIVFLSILILTPPVLQFLGPLYHDAYYVVIGLAVPSLLLICLQPRIQALNASVFVREKVTSSLALRLSFILPLCFLFFYPSMTSGYSGEDLILLVLSLKVISRVIFFSTIYYHTVTKRLVAWTLKNTALQVLLITLFVWGANYAIHS